MAIRQNVTVKALEGVIEASISARQALRQSETVLRRLQRRIEKGLSVAEAFAGLGMADSRRATFDSINALEHARREARRALIALGMSEGLSLGQMARQWGVSRQLVTRMAKESN
jgi:hypothetical protein